MVKRVFLAQQRDGKGATVVHPAEVESWSTEALQIPDAYDALLHRCRTGLAVYNGRGTFVGLAKRPTRFRTTSRHVAEKLDLKCECRVEHASLRGSPLDESITLRSISRSL